MNKTRMKIIVGLVAVTAIGVVSISYLWSVEDTSQRPLKEFMVIVRTFENGNFNPSTITVSKEDRVVIIFRSVDTTHGVAIEEFGINTGPIGPGQEKRVEFVVDKIGTSKFYCTIVCSGGHLRQVGQLIVQ